jgi:hypothetical protein
MREARAKEKVHSFNAKGFVCLSILVTIVCVPAFSAENIQTHPIVTQAHHVSSKVAARDLPDLGWHNASKVMPEHDRPPVVHTSSLPDTSVQTVTLPLVKTQNLLSFDGITDNQGGGFVPPDTNASVGDTQVVETVNVAYAVYSKADGHQIMAPKSLGPFYDPLGGVCQSGNLSDPVVNYDKAANRWVISMIAFNNNFSQNALCVGVSKTSDATGAYNLYSFSYNNVLPDYPKVGVWPDAYYVTTDSFPNGGFFSGAETCALDRSKMIAGTAATSVCFQRNSADFALLPADWDGATAPPAGSPNYQMDLRSATSLNFYKFHVDFANPNNSTYTGTTLTVASYNDACGGGTCIPQPSPGETLDSLSSRLMYRLPYRNYGDHEALVATHSIRPSGGSAMAAMRWYEVRSPGSSPAIFQQGSAQDSKISAWMGSIGMDKVGNIALGVSGSSSAVQPLIAYTGRVPSDPPGSLESPKVVVQGGGVQTNSFHRWGDYSSMAIDPSDDCTFWYTQEYYKTNGSFNFSTHMNSFKFTTCQ